VKIDFKENIRLIIAFILLIAVLLWVCNKEKWRSKKDPRQTPQKGMYANFMLYDSISILPHDVTI